MKFCARRELGKVLNTNRCLHHSIDNMGVFSTLTSGVLPMPLWAQKWCHHMRSTFSRPPWTHLPTFDIPVVSRVLDGCLLFSPSCLLQLLELLLFFFRCDYPVFFLLRAHWYTATLLHHHHYTTYCYFYYYCYLTHFWLPPA